MEVDKIEANSIPEKQAAYTLSVDEVLKAYESFSYGLKQSEAAVRLEQHGRNALPEAAGSTLFQLILSQFLSPLIYVLLAAAVISLLLEEFADAGFIFGCLSPAMAVMQARPFTPLILRPSEPQTPSPHERR
ncbi:cation-transporting P-type ATPase [Pseudomonadota bacterium]